MAHYVVVCSKNEGKTWGIIRETRSRREPALTIIDDSGAEHLRSPAEITWVDGTRTGRHIAKKAGYTVLSDTETCWDAYDKASLKERSAAGGRQTSLRKELAIKQNARRGGRKYVIGVPEGDSRGPATQRRNALKRALSELSVSGTRLEGNDNDGYQIGGRRIYARVGRQLILGGCVTKIVSGDIVTYRINAHGLNMLSELENAQ
jgi:hypothetical protein